MYARILADCGLCRLLKRARSVAGEYVDSAASAISVTVIIETSADAHAAACDALREKFNADPRRVSDIVICGVPWSQERCEAVACAIFSRDDEERAALARDHGVLFRAPLKDLQVLASRVIVASAQEVLPRDALNVLISRLIGQR